MTYADKYALIKVYKIISGDDPDQNKSEENIKTIEKNNLVTDLEAKTISSLFVKKGLNEEALLNKNYGITNTKKLTKEQYKSIIKAISKIPDKEIIEVENGSNTES